MLKVIYCFLFRVPPIHLLLDDRSRVEVEVEGTGKKLLLAAANLIG